jgi:hypothetical protein
MSSDRRIRIETLPTDVPNMVIEIEVYHSKGGRNFWSGDNEPAAYWVSVSPPPSRTLQDITLAAAQGDQGMIT